MGPGFRRFHMHTSWDEVFFVLSLNVSSSGERSETPGNQYSNSSTHFARLPPYWIPDPAYGVSGMTGVEDV